VGRIFTGHGGVAVEPWISVNFIRFAVGVQQGVTWMGWLHRAWPAPNYRPTGTHVFPINTKEVG
jgi:hypothetical protein